MDRQTRELTKLLRSGKSFKIRTYAAQKLGKLALQGKRGQPQVIRSLRKGLSDDHALVRGAAARGLGRHRARSALSELSFLAKRDGNRFVRQKAATAIKNIRKSMAAQSEFATRRKNTKGRPMTVEIGKVELGRSTGLSVHNKRRLAQRVKDSAEDQIEPHKPAIFPREKADYRISMHIQRRSGGRSSEVSYEAKVVLTQLPSGNLRHASSAVATAKVRRKTASAEEKVALKASGRAISDALDMLYGSSSVLANRF